MDSIELKETAMCPESRSLTQVTFDDARRDEYVQIMNVLIGDDIDGRKEYYQKYL